MRVDAVRMLTVGVGVRVLSGRCGLRSWRLQNMSDLLSDFRILLRLSVRLIGVTKLKIVEETGVMAIKWDRLTVKSQEAVQAASGYAAENGNPEVLPLHLMAALLEDREGVVIPVLEKVGVPVEQLLSGVNSAIAKLPKVQGGGSSRG